MEASSGRIRQVEDCPLRNGSEIAALAIALGTAQTSEAAPMTIQARLHAWLP
jgi:hypothetical protein